MRFKDSFYQANPRKFGSYTPQLTDPCLAPYWSSVDLDSFRNGTSRVTFCKYRNRHNDIDGAFAKASEYGKKILKKNEYETFWVTVITWYDLRPDNPGAFGGVSDRVPLNLSSLPGADHKSDFACDSQYRVIWCSVQLQTKPYLYLADLQIEKTLLKYAEKIQ